jgi:hypothetical protein
LLQTALVPSFVLHGVSSQQLPEKQVALQQTSAAFWLQALPVPVEHELATQLPLAKSQMLPEPHRLSLVHLPQKLACCAPQMGPLGLLVQSALSRQSPGMHAPELQRVPVP